MIIRFTVPGVPQGKARARMTRTGHAYTPDNTLLYENWIKQCFYDSKCEGDLTPRIQLQMILVAYYPIPMSISKKKQAMMTDGEIMPTCKPDLDNIYKCIADALNRIAYHDDSQIVRSTVMKFYSHEPRVEVLVKDFNYKECKHE